MTYKDWLIDLVCDDIQKICYQKILSLMYDVSFRWQIEFDENRVGDGLRLRHIYEKQYGEIPNKIGKCSILEVLIGLALRCEEDLMYDPYYENRTGVWFWIMMTNLGLDFQDDNYFSLEKSMGILNRMMDHKYSPDGRGGPFFIPGCRVDLRKVELWSQLNYYLQENFPV